MSTNVEVAGRYRLMELIARGGQATIYRALDLTTGELCAMKRMNPGAGRDERFFLEATLMTRLAHPNVVRVLGAGQDRGVPYIAMELCQGSLADHLEARGCLTFDEARGWLLQLLDALAVAHAAGIVHRDIKPSNLLIGADGRLKVTDFGIARTHGGPGLTQTGVGFGTLGYMAPEQRRSAASVTAAADLYAAGATFYELLTGEEPDDLWSPEARPPGFAALPPNVAGFVAMATAYDAADRFADAEDMQRALAMLDPTARRLDRRYRQAMGQPPSYGWVWVAFVALGGAAGAVVAWVIADQRTADQPAIEQATIEQAALTPLPSPAPPAPAPAPAVPEPRTKAPTRKVAPVVVAPELAPAEVPETQVFVNSRGGRAAVSMDGKPVGETVFRGSFPVGDHTLVLAGPDGAVVELPVKLEAGSPFAYCHDFAQGAPCAE